MEWWVEIKKIWFVLYFPDKKKELYENTEIAVSIGSNRIRTSINGWVQQGCSLPQNLFNISTCLTVEVVVYLGTRITLIHKHHKHHVVFEWLCNFTKDRSHL